MESITAAQLAWLSAGAFYFSGLVTGVWKYWETATRESARSHRYVSVAHQASFIHGFACLILGHLAAGSVYSAATNFWAVAVSVLFFALAVLTYVVHGILQDTTNQFQRPHRLGPVTLPNGFIVLFMCILTVALFGSFLGCLPVTSRAFDVTVQRDARRSRSAFVSPRVPRH